MLRLGPPQHEEVLLSVKAAQNRATFLHTCYRQMRLPKQVALHCTHTTLVMLLASDMELKRLGHLVAVCVNTHYDVPQLGNSQPRFLRTLSQCARLCQNKTQAQGKTTAMHMRTPAAHTVKRSITPRVTTTPVFCPPSPPVGEEMLFTCRGWETWAARLSRGSSSHLDHICLLL